MTLIIEIKSGVQAELARQAAVRGRTVEVYVASLLEEAAQSSHGAKHLSQDRLDEYSLARGSVPHFRHSVGFEMPVLVRSTETDSD